MWSGGFFRRERIIFARKIRLDMAEPRKTGRRTSVRAKVNVPEEDAYGHVQPQALEFEEAVLGALMIEQDAYSQVSEILRPESFYDHRHQLIYEAIRTLNLQQKPVDILTVKEQLSKEARKQLDSADVIIAKGMGNFESMYQEGINPYYLFLCKCDLFTRRFGVKLFDPIFCKEERLDIK